MGGVINLLSRRPSAEPTREFLVNRSTRGATDAVTFLSAPLARGWSASLLGGSLAGDDRREPGDAWADLPGYSRGVVRPRLFWDGGNGRTLFATTGFTYEDRDGGTPHGEVPAPIGQPYTADALGSADSAGRAADGRWTVDAWAPLEGRNVNGGLRVRF